MGQRHMTYIYVYDENGVDAVGALYNQWNHAPIQPQKIIRFEKMLTKWKRNKVLFPYEYSRWIELYEAAAMLSEVELHIKFHNEMPEYNKTYGMYDEDNNDGWQFVVIQVDSKNNYAPVKITYGFKPVRGSEFLNLYDNIMQDDDSKSEEHKLHKIENYLKDFNKTEQKILARINDSFDEEILKQVERVIKHHISKVGLKKTG